MNRKDMQRAFGNADDAFRLRLRQTLDGLEEKEMKKKYRLSTVLIAAVILVAVLAGAGIAASRLGIFDFLITGNPIVPLPGAEEMVATNLGTSENDYAVLSVEEAVFDGQGVMVKMRLSPKQEKHVMYDEFFADSPLVETQLVPMKIAEGIQEIWEWTVVNEGADKRLLRDGAELEIPATLEEAQEKNLPVYLEDGVLYDANQLDIVPANLEEGWTLIDYRISASVEDNLIFMNIADAQGHEDGSVVWWQSGITDEVLDVDEIKVRASADIYLDGEMIPLDEISFTLPKSEDERKCSIVPVGDGKGERFEILSGSIAFTKVRGYFNINYSYEQADTGEEMGITFRVYDAEGKEITTGSGSASVEPDENGVRWCSMEMQSFDDIPESIWLEAKVIGEDKTLGRVECELIEE